MRFAYLLLLSAPLFAQRTIPVDNEYVRVLSVVDQPTGKPGAPHEHTMNRVMIYLDAGHQRVRYADGRVSDLRFQPGDVKWSPGGGMHTSENAGGKPFRLVEVELKKPGGPFQPPKLDPLKVAPANYKVLLDNEHVRVLRAKLDPRQKLPLHEHARNRVAVYLTAQRVLSTPETGQPTELKAAPFDVRFSAPLKHAEENLSNELMEVLLVELK